jgi:hypothetical protein
MGNLGTITWEAQAPLFGGTVGFAFSFTTNVV